MTRRTAALSPLLALLLAPAAAPAEEPAYVRNQVSFAVSRSADVSNDRMSAVLVATHEAPDAALAASRVNEAMGQALEVVRGRQGVEHRTGGYTTRQVHTPPPSREVRWRVEQELVLESADFEAVRALVSELQSRLQLRSMGFDLSREARIAAERRVTEEALRAFREEAERIRKTLGFERYEIVELRVGGDGAPPEPPPYARTMMAEADAAGAPVALEAGWSEVRVGVDARIQLE